MASDDDNRAAAEVAEFKRKLEAMVVAAETAKKKADANRARVLAAAALLEEEQRSAATLEDEARAAAFLIEPPPPTSQTETAGPSLTPGTADYEAAVITNLHIQATGVPNIRSVVLDSSSEHFFKMLFAIVLHILDANQLISCLLLMLACLMQWCNLRCDKLISCYDAMFYHILIRYHFATAKIAREVES
jgi:hypothetical protein